MVFSRLAEAGLQLDIDKCEFEVHSITYLGYVLQAAKGVSIDPADVDALVNWLRPSSVKDVRAFIEFANFYKRFIKTFSTLAYPLIRLTKKDVPFRWEEAEQSSFEQLNEMFVTVPKSEINNV